jgi:RND family efflux transporter MFP subunit
MNGLRTTLAATALALLAACGSPDDGRRVPPLPALDTLAVDTGGIAAGRAWDGVVEAVQQAELGAQTGGRVIEVAVDVDDRVRAGDILLRLTAVEQQAGADIARAQLHAAEAAAVEAETNFRRYSQLADEQLVSRAQLDQARTARNSAVAARDAARAQLVQAGQQVAYTVVRAPFDGIVGARHVEPGESVAPGQPLLSMHAPGALRIEVQVPQSEAAAIAAAGRARILLDDGRAFEAARTIVHPAADPRSHSIGVRLLLPRIDPAPAPGTTAKVVFPTGDDTAIAIPASAVTQRGELSGVYVVADDRIALRQLRLGERIGGRVEVVAGLRAGETIAADPVAALQVLVAQREAVGSGNE